MLVVVPCGELVLVLEVEEDDEVVDEGGTAVGPQNCTFETSGVLPWPTFGRPAFEKVPLSCGGVNDVNTDAGPPFTMMPETASVDCHVAPEADAPLSVTTCSLPAGDSKL